MYKNIKAFKDKYQAAKVSPVSVCCRNKNFDGFFFFWLPFLFAKCKLVQVDVCKLRVSLLEPFPLAEHYLLFQSVNIFLECILVRIFNHHFCYFIFYFLHLWQHCLAFRYCPGAVHLRVSLTSVPACNHYEARTSHIYGGGGNVLYIFFFFRTSSTSFSLHKISVIWSFF